MKLTVEEFCKFAGKGILDALGYASGSYGCEFTFTFSKQGAQTVIETVDVKLCPRGTPEKL